MQRTFDIPHIVPSDIKERLARSPHYVSPQALAALAVLVEQRHRPVTPLALADAVYSSFDGTRVLVYMLRKALGDDRRHPAYIQTVRQTPYGSPYGYQYIGPVAESEATC